MWLVRLAHATEDDFREIVRWTHQQFGEAQAVSYAKTLSAALTCLTEGPAMSGARPREDIARGLFTLHVARKVSRVRDMSD